MHMFQGQIINDKNSSKDSTQEKNWVLLVS